MMPKDAIRDYIKRGYSLLPFKAIPPAAGETKWKKKPFVKWEDRQGKAPDESAVLSEFEKYPNALIGCVTGRISKICTLDIDDDEGRKIANELVPDSLLVPTFKTMSGGLQMVFQNPEPSIPGQVRFCPGLDYRGEGSLAILPPGSNGNGGQYCWLDGLSLTEVEPPPLPDAIFNILKKAFNNKRAVRSELTDPYKTLQFLTEGRRDNDLFNAANSLIKGGCEIPFVEQIIDILARNSNPPFPENEIRTKIDSALKRAERRDRNLKQEFLEWVHLTEGYWNLTEACRALQILQKEERNHLYVIAHRLKAEGIIEKYGNQAGVYRTVSADIEPIDFMNCTVNALSVRYPFQIERHIKTLPKNIIVVAGSPDAGKTAFLLNFARLNQDKHDVHYFSSEMGAMELRERLSKFDSPLDSWHFKVWEKSSNFADSIKPDAVNVIDFMELHSDFWQVGGMIKAIHDKLKNGIAVIALQKPQGRDEGLGGQRGLEKPRLYLAMEAGKIKIVKAKNWVTSDRNPNGLTLDYKIVAGCKFMVTKEWYKT